MNHQIISRKPGFAQGLFLILPIVLGVVGVSVFTATVNLMQQHFSYVPNGAYWVNLLQTMPGFWIVAFSPIAGWLADRLGRRNILMLSMVVYALVGMAPFWLENIWTILLTRCFVGMCESVVLTVTTTMLCDYFHGRTRERWLASQTGVASLSALLIIPLGGALGARYGWQGPFLVYFISLVLVVFVAIYTWEPEHVAPTTDEIAMVNADAIYQSIPWARMSGIILITLVGSIFFYSTITQNANALVQLGVKDPARIGAYATWASLGVPVGTVLFWFLGRLHINLLLCIDFLIIGIGFTLMSTASTPAGYVMAADLQQVGCGLVLPTLLVWATRGLAYHVRGRGNGLWQGAFGLGLFASGIVLQYMGSLYGGSILAAFGVLGRFGLAAAGIALVAWIVLRRSRRA
ncbi:MAG: MFS transporter [Proteobacteria bacterium]|nr:MFS transporter [Pseudomonadota bacterium]